MEATIPPQQICPLCGKNNHCAMAINPADKTCSDTCWCFTASLNKDSLSQAQTQNKNCCICPECAKLPYVKTARDEFYEK